MRSHKIQFHQQELLESMQMQQQNNIFNQIQKKRASLRNRNSFIIKKSFILFPLATEEFNLSPSKPSKELRSSRSEHSNNAERKIKTLKKGGSVDKAPKIQQNYHKTQQKHASNKSIKLDESLMAIEPKRSGRKIHSFNINQEFKDYLTYIRAEQDQQYQLRVNFQNMRKRNRRDPLKNKEKQVYSTIYNILLKTCQNLLKGANQNSKLIFQTCQRYFGLYEKIKIQIIISIYYPAALHSKLRSYFLNQRIAFFILSALSVDEGLKNLSRTQIQSLKLIFQLLVQGYNSLLQPILLQEKEVVSNINEAFRLLKSAGEVQKKLLIIDKQMSKINIQSDALSQAQSQLKSLGKMQNQWSLQVLAEKETKLAWHYLKIPPVPYLPLKNTLKRYTLVIEIDNTLIYYNKETKILKYRPYIDLFLHKINNFFEIVAFNRSEQKYTTVLISQIERKKRLFSYILSEHHLVQTDGGLMKDISRLNRQQSLTLIIDWETSYYQEDYKKNILKIDSWHGDKSDKQLQKILIYIEELIKSKCEDIRDYMDKNKLSII